LRRDKVESRQPLCSAGLPRNRFWTSRNLEYVWNAGVGDWKRHLHCRFQSPPVISSCLDFSKQQDFRSSSAA
jgi:hypothetical protein